MKRLLEVLGIGGRARSCAEPGCDEVAGKPLEKGDPAYCAAHLLRSPSLQRRLAEGPGSKFRQDLDRSLSELAGADAAAYSAPANAAGDGAAPSGDADGWDMEELIKDVRRNENPGDTGGAKP